MNVHLLDIDEGPIDESTVFANCGMEIEFIPKFADFDGLKICSECLKKHLLLRKLNTFALIK